MPQDARESREGQARPIRTFGVVGESNLIDYFSDPGLVILFASIRHEQLVIAAVLHESGPYRTTGCKPVRQQVCLDQGALL